MSAPTPAQNVLIGFAIVLGAIALLFACLAHAWTGPSYPSIKPSMKPPRFGVDEWSWPWLNHWYANSEDGVSGQRALVWTPTGELIWYRDTFPSWMPEWIIAYAWSAWRNNANNLKRPFRTDGLNAPY